MYLKYHTFFLEAERWQEPYTITGSEAHHLARVLRLTPGSTVRLMDGRGRTGLFTVSELSRKQVSLERQEIRIHSRPWSRVHLALAWNKSFRRSWLLEKAVELGAWKIILWQARYSQGRTRDAIRDNWQGKLIAGAKQCLNPWLPRLEFMHDGIHQLIASSREMEARILLWEEEKDAVLMDYYQKQRPLEKIIVVGPEGGLAREEVEELIQSGFVSLSLGPRVLRWETAALAPLFLDMLFFPHQVSSG